MEKIITLLHTGNYSCVIEKSEIRCFSQRGVADLYNLLNNEPEFLDGSRIADKVVGKAAAALMVVGKVKTVYTDLISEPALRVLEEAGIEHFYGKRVSFIRNREQSGWCPLESSCKEAKTPEDVFSAVKAFIQRVRGENKG